MIMSAYKKCIWPPNKN